ncbi:HRDC domain-containing protein [Lysinibacter sp. HNR]|uniref:HRDC domain-containing protein n=1 Tax=Lysinibacter sp. HNR TaxID=3031408 RepID=UPI002434DA1A|nr:HRDC domain-containing protein [Lysinibacter sp. HNR]WGD36319.1 HRDC domain-containing protein [Lysinibacter sp. HNR]
MSDWQLVTDQDAFHSAIDLLASGTGALGVDAERASGYRYAQRAYLIQFYREGAGTFLFDPVAIESFAPLQDRLSQIEWVFHAASQDLPSLREVGLDPVTIFDTELAARLLGMPRVGLGAVVEELLGIHLAKEHSAVDWSTRPLPVSWLDYAAADVELLPTLREILSQHLAQSEKTEFAHEEFIDVLHRQPKPPPEDPWRKMSGIHKITGLRNLAVARELWLSRDELARTSDISPGRLIPDAAIVSAALEMPRSKKELAAIKTFNGRASKREIDRWWEAVLAGRKAEQLPLARPKNTHTIPPHRTWKSRYPEAYNRLSLVREALIELGAQVNIPLENLVTPEVLRRICWSPPQELTTKSVSLALGEAGARPWQINLAGETIASTLVDIHQNIHESSEEDSLKN